MSESEILEISETFLREMLEADDNGDFESFTKRFESKYLENFTVEQFQSDIEAMHERNGMNQGYKFLSMLRSSEIDGNLVHRSVWKGIYEKRDAVIELGIYKKQNSWHVLISAVH